jgi:acyl-CoA synthetase
LANALACYDLELEWKVNTLKCVDATPTLLLTAGENLKIFIGSHSHQFICVDGESGHLNWTFHAQDRIESSACVSKCGNYVIFGRSCACS